MLKRDVDVEERCRCGKYICKLKRHIQQVHHEVTEEECLATVLRNRLSEKAGKTYFYCSFESETGIVLRNIHMQAQKAYSTSSQRNIGRRMFSSCAEKQT